MANPTARFPKCSRRIMLKPFFYVKKTHALKFHMHGTCQTNIHRRKQQHKHHHLNPTLETQKVPSKIHPLSQLKQWLFKNTNINKKYMFLILELPQYFLFANKTTHQNHFFKEKQHTPKHIEPKKNTSQQTFPNPPPKKKITTFPAKVSP